MTRRRAIPAKLSSTSKRSSAADSPWTGVEFGDIEARNLQRARISVTWTSLDLASDLVITTILCEDEWSFRGKEILGRVEEKMKQG
jgi:hypothetical protein